MDKEKIRKAVFDILCAIGEDPDRPGLKGTPERVARMFEEILGGEKRDISEILGRTHELEHDEMVVVRDINFYTMCEHHLLPFFGVCHIAYVPDDRKIVGISKLARIVDVLSKRLQVQEQFTNQIADALMLHVKPKGVAVVVKARHMCMEMRGVQKPGARTITSVVRGLFRSDMRTRDEFLKLIE
ncbi:MAG: GTP cyclohydrolase I FolE [Spirochaetes bacterium RBG_13_51_14]|nr:MAG: GTP cyclohydrolase I FolE [Spirochaetes bacterium RBG_13_51_14]